MIKDQTLNLEDLRDKNSYTVAKLSDDQCWMTQNLRIGSDSQPIQLNSETSDIADNFTLPISTVKTVSTPSDNSGWHQQQYDIAHIYIDTNDSYGTLYTWFAATAGEGRSSFLTQMTNTQYSICPKGWRLPTSDEIIALANTYRLNSTYMNTPPSFDISSWAGLCDERGCPRDQGSRGYWWVSTVSDSSQAFGLYANDANFYRGSYYKGRGLSVRCVARNE